MGNPLPFLERCARKYGDVFTLRLFGFDPVVHVSSPEDLKILFTADPEVVHAGESSFSLSGAIVGRGTLFTMESTAHLRRRRILMPPFHGERIQEYATLIREITEQTVASWKVGRRFALHPHMQEIALRVILRAVFGLGRDAEAERLGALVERLATSAVGSKLLLLRFLQIDLGRWSPWGRLLQLVRDTHAALDAEIARRRADPTTPSRTDVLSLLLTATDEDNQPLSNEQLRDELIMLLVAGHDTAALTLTWAFESILSTPSVLARLKAEIADVTGGAPVEREHMSQLEYLDAALKEAMRLRPIMPTAGARKLQAPLALRHYTLPAGTLVANSEYLLHRHPDLYPEPEVFRPERFLGRKVSPYEWTPFGGGVRRCLGMAFALYEMKMVLATVLQRASLRLAGTPVKIGRRGFFISPADELRVVMTAPARSAGVACEPRRSGKAASAWQNESAAQ